MSAIDAINAATRASSTPTASSNSLDKDTFLKLLVAQLRYQNPLSPTDPTEFMSQTAQFTMVEQLEKMATNQEASSLAQQLTTAGSLVAAQVTYLKEGVAKTGIVSAARIINGGTWLVIGNDLVGLGTIQSVSLPGTPVATADSVGKTGAADETDSVDETASVDETDATGDTDAPDETDTTDSTDPSDQTNPSS